MLAGRRDGGTLSMVLGAVGGGVVVLGWLAAARVENYAYGLLNSAPVIVLLALATTGLAITALAPAGCLRPPVA